MKAKSFDEQNGIMLAGTVPINNEDGPVGSDAAPAVEQPSGGFRLDDPVPCDAPVAGAELLREIVDVINAFVVLRVDQAVALALWIMHTYVHDAFPISPMACISSADMRGGKSTTVGVVGMLACRPLAASNVSPAVVYRVVSEQRPTLLIDEADSFLRGDNELRGILNSGHTRAAAMVIRASGGNHEPRAYRTWCPKLVALIGGLPDTLADRSIEIRLRRKLPTELVKRVTPATHEELAPLRSRIARWAQDSFAALATTRPVTPDGLNDRASDNWWPLLAIADEVGGVWPNAARQAAVALTPAEVNQENLSVSLLKDIRVAFAHTEKPRMFTDDLLASLLDMEESPWRNMRGRQRLDAHVLAKMLRPYDVTPRVLRIGRRLRRGYELGDFQDAFIRYLPPASDDRNVVPAPANAGHVAATEASHVRATEARDPLARLIRAAKEASMDAAAVEKLPTTIGEDGESNLMSTARTFGTVCSRMLERRIQAGDQEAVEEARRLRDSLDSILPEGKQKPALAASVSSSVCNSVVSSVGISIGIDEPDVMTVSEDVIGEVAMTAETVELSESGEPGEPGELSETDETAESGEMVEMVESAMAVAADELGGGL